ncbi:MAG: hypothetical protein QOI21_5491 [Actinomycetota bacterium]|nr:hypothetical protein [Actinomycetota bacterium]
MSEQPTSRLPRYAVAPQTTTAKKGNKGLKIAMAIGVPLLALALVAVVFRVLTASTGNVGDCFTGDSADINSLQSSDCGAGARYKVIGKVDDQSEFQLRVTGSVCDQFPNADVAFWQGRSGSTGTVLCLEDVQNPGNRMPAVGDCLNGDLADAKTMTKVGCGPDAAYKVAGNEDGGLVTGITPLCTKVPAAAAAFVWERPGAALASKKVLCLQDLKNPDNRRPAVGDCFAANVPAGQAAHFVACDAAAGIEVIGQIDKTSKFDSLEKTAEQICSAFPGADEVYWWGFQNSLTGSTFCLKTLKR